MSVVKTLNSTGQSYELPQNRESPGWGEDTSNFLLDVADTLNDLQSSGDILQSVSDVANNQIIAANVAGLSFNLGVVRSSVIDYSFYRQTSTTELVECGQMMVAFHDVGSPTYELTRFATGDAGVTVTFTAAGQAQFTTTNMSGTGYVGKFRFKASSFSRD